MAGIGLSRLWSSHTRIAFAVHLFFSVLAGYAAVTSVTSGAGWVSLFVVAAFLLLAATLVLLTWAAHLDGWRPTDDDSYREPMVSLGVAWRSAQVWERIDWALFAMTFTAGLVLLAFARSLVGFALVVVSIVLAVLGMRLKRAER